MATVVLYVHGVYVRARCRLLLLLSFGLATVKFPCGPRQSKELRMFICLFAGSLVASFFTSRETPHTILFIFQPEKSAIFIVRRPQNHNNEKNILSLHRYELRLTVATVLSRSRRCLFSGR